MKTAFDFKKDCSFNNMHSHREIFSALLSSKFCFFFSLSDFWNFQLHTFWGHKNYNWSFFILFFSSNFLLIESKLGFIFLCFTVEDQAGKTRHFMKSPLIFFRILGLLFIVRKNSFCLKKIALLSDTALDANFKRCTVWKENS
jgi:hypothetical protein